MNKIDLHGLNGQDAVSRVQTKIMGLTHGEVLEVVVGRGTGALSNAVGSYLDEEGYQYEFINNAIYIIYL